MSLFDNISGAINSATTAITTVKNTFNSLGSATGLSSVFDNVTGFLNNFGGNYKTLDIKFPVPNPLFDYASYDYVLGIGCLSDEEANAPDATYMSGSRIDLICKSANADFDNRVQTAYGQFDFFIDNLVLEQSIGFEHDSNTNVTDINFSITEPYSMGMFFISLETLARNKGHMNWRDATWTLTIEFRGNIETGKMGNIPNTFRCIPFVITDIDMTVDEKGALYQIGAMPTSQVALANEYKNFKTDVSVDGKSVQEILQTGPNSLQVYLNTVADEEAKRRGSDFVPDEYVIVFPKDWSSSAANKINESSAGATTDLTITQDGLNSILGVTRVTPVKEGKRGNLEQDGANCNELGRAIIDVDDKRTSTPPTRKNDEVFDDSGNVIKGQVNTIIDPRTSNFKFPQGSDIPNAINQVLLKSDFVKQTLGPDALTPEGWKKWWRLDMQVYKITTNANLPHTGEKPKVIVIRIIPYNVHASRVTATNVKTQGFDKLKNKEAVKQYDYIYTGKNIDIKDFKIFFDNGFLTSMLADSFSKNSDIITGTQSGEGVVKAPIDPLAKGNAPEEGVIPMITKFFKTITNTDNKGGSGPDSAITRAARLFHDAITKTQGDMIELDMTIIGDPYYIAHSGMGNYTGSPTSNSSNLLTDGSINYQNGEVDIVVNFRTPIDINQGTGLYTFTGTTLSAPVNAWSGIYRVTEVTSTFKSGEFMQKIGGFRRPYQEATQTPDNAKSFNSQGTPPPANSDAADPTDYNTGPR
jgi:hypothetical protein